MPRTLLARLALLACLSLYFIHLIILQGAAVNVPYWDEWDAFDSGRLSADLSLTWLFAQHNEHKIVTTKLLTWVLYRLNGWNHITHLTVNFLLYGLLLFTVVRFAKKVVPRLESWVTLSFVVFLLSPINFENHFWGFQTSFHLSLLFFLASVYFLYGESQEWPDLLLGSLMAVLSIYSLSSGLISSLINLFIFCLFKFSLINSAADAGKRRRELKQLLMVVGVVGGALAWWFVDYHGVEQHPPHVWPYTKSFWVYFVNILGLGFGLDARAFLLNCLCLLIVVTPVASETWKRRGHLPSSSWAVYAAVAGILSALIIITIGRASFGVEQAKSSRYSEISMMLIPLSVFSWTILLQSRTSLRTCVLICLWFFCCFAFWDNWSQFSVYKSLARERMKGVLCIERYYAGNGDANCPSVSPAPLAQRLDEAKKLNPSFYRAVRPFIGLNQSTQTSVDGETLYSVDVINGRQLQKDSSVIVNSQTTSEVTVGGWAVDIQARSEAGGVFIVIDGEKDVPTVYGLERQDVMKAHNNPRYMSSGFAGSIPIKMLEKGHHILTLKILRTSGNGHYAPAQKINIEVR